MGTLRAVGLLGQLAVQLQQGQAWEAEAEPSSPCPAAVALSWLVPRVSGQGQGEGLEAGAFAIGPSCSGLLLLGADEKSLRLERTTKQPLPSSLGSRKLWSQAGSRCEAALAASARAGPQLLPPSPHPGVSLQPWSCPPPSQWGSGAAACIPALCKQHPCLQRLLKSPLSWGKSSGLTREDRWGPLSF